MTHRLIIAPRAEADLQAAFVWYEKQSAGLGHDFPARAERQFALISQAPQLFRFRVGRYRLAATSRFPYAIYFIFDEITGVISVRRLLHFKQDRRGNVT